MLPYAGRPTQLHANDWKDSQTASLFFSLFAYLTGTRLAYLPDYYHKHATMDAMTVGVMQGLTPEAAALSVQIKSSLPYSPCTANRPTDGLFHRDNVKLAQTLGACGFAVCLWDTLAYLHIEYNVVWVSTHESHLPRSP